MSVVRFRAKAPKYGIYVIPRIGAKSWGSVLKHIAFRRFLSYTKFMAANNETLLNKFAKLFSSSDYLSTTQGLLLAKSMWGFLEPAGKVPMPQEPAAMLNAINQRFEAILSDQQIDDQSLVAYLMTLEPKDIMAMGSDLVADVMESPAYQALKPADRQSFERQVNDVYGYLNVDYKVMENLNTVVLNEESLRRMVDASADSQRAKKTAHGKIDNALTAFDNAYRNVDLTALENGPKHYGNVFTPQANLLGKMRASYVNILGEKEGNRTADLNEDLINLQNTQGEKNAYLVSAVAAHDETVMAIFKRHNVDAQKHNKAFLGSEIDGSDKNNQHFLPNLMKTIGGAGKTFGIAAGASFAVNLLSNIPVVGNFVGPAMAIATVVKKAHSEYKQAAQIAAMQNRTLDRRDAARIAVNTAASVAPYAITMAAGPIGRYIGAGTMAVKSFFTDLNQKKTKLRETEKLAVKDYLASAGKAILNSAALWLGGKAGSALGSAVADKIDGQGLLDDFRTNVANVRTGWEKLKSGNLNAGNTTGNITDNSVDNTLGDDISLTAPGDKLTTSNIAADQNSLKTLQNHKFDLTDATRSTANPDANRMYQADGAGNYRQNDWYSVDEYQRAIDTLHEAGVQDADGALRNLAGARMFKGGEFKTELDNLLNGKLTDNTINKILEADSILDEHGALMSGRTINPVQHETNIAPERVTDYHIVDEPVEMSPMPEPELVTDAEIPADPTFGPERMTDYKLAEELNKEPVTAETAQDKVIFNETVKPEPVVENDPTFGPERMTDYELSNDGGVVKPEPVVKTDATSAPERVADYTVTDKHLTDAEIDELYFGPNRRVIFTENSAPEAEPEMDVEPELPTAEHNAEYVPDTDVGAENLTDEATFGLNRMGDYHIESNWANDWQGESYDAMLEHAMDDIAGEYQAPSVKQTVEPVANTYQATNDMSNLM